MAITILERPEGYIIGNSSAGIVTESSGVPGAVNVGAPLHGLASQSVIYIESVIGNYNGFLKIESVDANNFRLLDLAFSNYIQYVNDVTITWYTVFFPHGWSAVHLPITYKLSNNLYPTNNSDTSRNINSVQDANGYTVLQLSGSLGAVHSYDFVIITVPNNTELSGVYQILEYISDTVLLINLRYDSTHNFTSATALKQYNNYTVLVRVYAGINAAHQWAAQKPYELAATLEFTPDDNNEVFFSINEILKSYIETRNNLVLGTLPNNIDFWTNFYIETAEKYDDSDGYTFGSFTSSFTTDDAEGTAANAKLDFKNTYSGFLSEYLMTNSAAKFLTLFSIPVLFQCGDDTPNCYQDISWINPDKSAILATTFRKQYYLNGVFQTTVSDSIAEDSGVIRTEIEADCDYDRVDVTILGGEQLIDEPLFNATGDWQQTVTVPGAAWTISGGMASVLIVSAGSSEYLYQSISGSSQVYRVLCNVSTTDGGAPDNDWQATVFAVFFTGGTGGTEVLAQSLGIVQGSAVGDTPTLEIDTQFTVPGSFDTIAIFVGGFGGVVDTVTVHIEDFYVAEVATQLSETKQFKIDCGCSQQEIRLTWSNNLPGFDYWVFTAQKDHLREIQEAITTKKNIFPNWPKSYGADADTIKRQTKRVSNKAYTVRSQFISEDEQDAIAYIKSSLLVQITNSQLDRRTVLVDTDSFVMRKDGDKTFEVAFNISFTDDIPVQTL